MTPTSPASGYDPLGQVADHKTATLPPTRIAMASPTFGPEEAAAVQAVLTSGVLTNGPRTRQFEDEMALLHGTDHAVAMSSGTVALAAMLLAEGIGPGDEVIVPSLTFIASASSVLHVGATPVFADVEADSFMLDPDDVEARITAATRAIMPVHYAGQSAELDRFQQMCQAHGLILLEDAAQAHGANFADRPVGSWGHSAMFSFTPTKNITTGEGAVITTTDAALARHLRLLRNHGMSKQYHHEIVGYNWRLSELHAAIGVCQIPRLASILETKRANARLLADLFEGVSDVRVPTELANRDHPYTLYTLTLPSELRERVASALSREGIETRVYFPPAHKQPIFAAHRVGPLPVTESLAERILSIPFHWRLSRAELAEIAEIVIATVRA